MNVMLMTMTFLSQVVSRHLARHAGQIEIVLDLICAASRYHNSGACAFLDAMGERVLMLGFGLCVNCLVNSCCRRRDCGWRKSKVTGWVASGTSGSAVWVAHIYVHKFCLEWWCFRLRGMYNLHKNKGMELLTRKCVENGVRRKSLIVLPAAGKAYDPVIHHRLEWNTGW